MFVSGKPGPRHSSSAGAKPSPEYQEVVELLGPEFQKLHEYLSSCKDERRLPEQFYKCLADIADTWYPGICQRAWAVPAFYFSDYPVRPYVFGGKQTHPAPATEESEKEKCSLPGCPETPAAASTDSAGTKDNLAAPAEEIGKAKSIPEAAFGENPAPKTSPRVSSDASAAAAFPEEDGQKRNSGASLKGLAAGRPGSAKARRPSLQDSCQQLVVSDRPESGHRGDTAERVLGRAFRILNVSLEKEREETMFIITKYEYVNMLQWIRKPNVAQKYFKEKFVKVSKEVPECMNFEEVNDLCSKRHEADLMILHPTKGILFIQIKSINRQVNLRSDDDKTLTGTKHLTDDKIIAKIDEADAQLEIDAKILNKVMERSKFWRRGQGQRPQITQIIAVPNLTGSEVAKLRAKAKVRPETVFLCNEHTMKEDADSKREAESQANIDGLRKFWKEDLQPTARPLTLECLQEIVGLYVGPFSSVKEPRGKSLCELIQTYKQCVKRTGLLSSRLLLTDEQRDIVEERTRGQRRVYISGPPGSGKTLLLITKAHNFLAENPLHKVEVVNMYIGAEGRSIGQHIVSTLCQITHRSVHDRIHLLSIDLHKKQFVQKVTGTKTTSTPATGSGPKQKSVAAPTTRSRPEKKSTQAKAPSGTFSPDPKQRSQPSSGAIPKTPKAAGGEPKDKESSEYHSMDEDPKNTLKHVLFIVDEVYIEYFWDEILDAFKGELSESEVWCAGLFSTCPEGFQEHGLGIVHRCPPAVQNLLYHVDWKEERKEKYRRDTEWTEVPSNGPIPLCLQHQLHVQAGKGDCVLNCASCATQLADLLKEENMIKPPSTRSMSAPQPSTSKNGASKTTPPCTELKMVILVNLPRNAYHKEGGYIQTTEEKYRDYMAQVKRSSFITTLENCGIRVAVKDQLASKDLAKMDGSTHDVLVTWIYNFQGLEADVVIVLPGDPSPPPGACPQEQEIPTPGLRPASSGHVDRKAEASSGAGSSRAVKPASGLPSDAAAAPGRSRRDTGGEALRSLGSLHWRTEDLERYSLWDKTNVLVAGSRTLSLLILLVP